MADALQTPGLGAQAVGSRLREELSAAFAALDLLEEPLAGMSEADGLRGSCYRLLRDGINLSLYSRPPAPPVRVEMRETLSRLLAAAGALLELSGRPLRSTLPEEPFYLLCDRALLLGGILNLLSNSGRFAPAGKPISVCCRVQGGWMRLIVLDRGRGMEPAALARATEPYFSWEDGAPAGLGLGLAVARRAATAHRGRLALAADPGSGCAASLTLPLRDDPRLPLLPAQSARELLCDRYSPLWVLLSHCRWPGRA